MFALLPKSTRHGSTGASRGATVRRKLTTSTRRSSAPKTLQDQGAIAFEYGNNIRGQVAEHCDRENAFDYPGFVSAYIRPLFCRGKGPFRWVALSGDPTDIQRTNEAVKELFPEKDHLHRCIDLA